MIAGLPQERHWRRYARIAAVAVALLAVFVVPAIGGAIDAYVALLAVLLGSIVLFDPAALRAPFHNPGVRAFLLAFALLGVAFVLSAQSPADPFALVDFLHLLFVIPAFALLSRLAAPRNGRIVVGLALLGCIVTLAVGLFQVHVLGMGRATGGINSILFANIGVLLGFVALGGLLLPGLLYRWLYAIAPLAGLAVAILGGTRGSFVAAAALALVFLGFAVSAWRDRAWLIIGGTVGVLVIAGALAAMLFDLSRILTVFDTTSQLVTSGATSDMSTALRLEFYRAGLRAFAESPIWGHGWWRRFQAALPYLTGAARDFQADRAAHLHNDIINLASGAGLLGVAAYISMILAPLAGVWRSPPDSQFMFRCYAATVLTVGYFVVGLTDVMFVIELPKTMFCLIAAVLFAFCRDEDPVPSGPSGLRPVVQ